MLPCFHTVCLKCLEDIQSKNHKFPGDALPCPMCRTEFTIPPDGMIGLKKNFFIESLKEVTQALDVGSGTVLCSGCKNSDKESEPIEATMRCLNCRENYCTRCTITHNNLKLTKDHKVVDIKSQLNSDEIQAMVPVRYCSKHAQKVLDYYCADCKSIVCVSCFVEEHKFHDCKDVTTVDKDFRSEIGRNSEKISEFIEDMVAKKTDLERKKREYISKTYETENAITVKSRQLKALIDQQKKSLLTELGFLREKHKKKIEEEIEEIDRKLSVLEGFEQYCTDIKLKGSPSEVCGCVDELLQRSSDFGKVHQEYIDAPETSVEMAFIPKDFENIENNIGELNVDFKQFESKVITIGMHDDGPITQDVIAISLKRAVVSYLPQLPTEMQRESAAAVHRNSIFVAGLGNKSDEIWRFDATSSNWKKCASMVQGRRRHSVAFVNHVLYICGGYVDSNNSTLDDVEAYDTIDNKCSHIGKLTYAVRSSSNCVPFKTSLYIFGGADANGEALSSVQVYDTKLNTCTLLPKPMPEARRLLRAVLWENSVILLSINSCFVYNFDAETWQVRDKFKVGVVHFGLTVNNGKIFVFGGGKTEKDFDGKTWIFRDDVRYIPVMNIMNNEPIEWKFHTKLPNPLFAHAFGKIDVCV